MRLGGGSWIRKNAELPSARCGTNPVCQSGFIRFRDANVAFLKHAQLRRRLIDALKQHEENWQDGVEIP
jgi:hypothetical protein